jgi:hypothetical protein
MYKSHLKSKSFYFLIMDKLKFKNGKRVMSSKTGIYYSNGQLAFSNESGDIFFVNGKQAFSYIKNQAYRENGKILHYGPLYMLRDFDVAALNAYSAHDVEINFKVGGFMVKCSLGDGLVACFQLDNEHLSLSLLRGPNGEVIFEQHDLQNEFNFES